MLILSKKLDLCMWTLNGEKTLDAVLLRINQVIPSEVVGQRFIVDDGSHDNTVKIAESHGWKVLQNEGCGISDGANTALKHIKSEFFCSFEQDLLLTSDWWTKLSKYVGQEDVAAVLGVRYADKPLGLRKLEQYSAKRTYKIVKHPEQFGALRVKEAETSRNYWLSLDNTIYNTKILLTLGGFPSLPNFGAGTDSLLSKKIMDSGYKVVCDYNIVSTHLRSGLRNELKHCLWCSQTYPILKQTFDYHTVTLASMVPRLAFSPFRALEIAVKEHEPSIIYIYPLMRFASFKGMCNGYKEARKWKYRV